MVLLTYLTCLQRYCGPAHQSQNMKGPSPSPQMKPERLGASHILTHNAIHPIPPLKAANNDSPPSLSMYSTPGPMLFMRELVHSCENSTEWLLSRFPFSHEELRHREASSLPKVTQQGSYKFQVYMTLLQHIFPKFHMWDSTDTLSPQAQSYSPGSQLWVSSQMHG